MVLEGIFKWIAPFQKPVLETKLHSPSDDKSENSFFSANSVIGLNQYDSKPTSIGDLSTFSTGKSIASADRLTSLMTVTSNSDAEKALEYSTTMTESGDGLIITRLFSGSEMFDPSPSDELRKSDTVFNKSSCSPLKSSADYENNYQPTKAGGDYINANNKLTVNRNTQTKFLGPQNLAASPLVSNADSYEKNISTKCFNSRKPVILKELDKSSLHQITLDTKPIDTKGIKRNQRSIFVQTDRRETGLPTSIKPSFRSNKNDENMQVEYSKSKQCLSLEKFVATSKKDFRGNLNITRKVIDECVYGELLVFGCNGSPPSHLRSQMQSKFVLRKRLKANGVKEAFCYVTSGGTHRPLRQNLTVSYNVSPNRSVVVEYIRDKSTDMFQIGRYESPPVDFQVTDVTTGHLSRNGVSRFACRIIVQRHGSHEAKLYAAAFDSCGNIFLGEKALTCVREGKMDGFTTNGVFILHPNCPVWREVSVCGFVYPIRSTDIEPKKRPRLSRETNILQDGTLIDLCGVTLLWRTPIGLENTPKEECLQKLNTMLYNMAPECQPLTSVQSRTYVGGKKQPYVFLCCGHVIRLNEDLVLAKSFDGWSCPICRCVGSIAKLEVGKEPGFFIDSEFPSHALRPCGHVTNLKTANYWSRIKIPEHRNIETGFCPFCGMKLNSVKKYVELLIPQ